MSPKLIKQLAERKKKRAKGAGRKPGFKHPPATREGIRSGMALAVLEKIVEGKINATPQRVSAAIALLRKTLPDLNAVDHTTKGEAVRPVIVSYKDYPTDMTGEQQHDDGAVGTTDREPDTPDSG